MVSCFWPILNILPSGALDGFWGTCFINAKSIRILNAMACAGRMQGAGLTCIKVEKYHLRGLPVAVAARRRMGMTLWNADGQVLRENGQNV